MYICSIQRMINTMLTSQEIKDLLQGLPILMKHLDTGNFADKKLADRLELIETKLKKLQ